MKYQFETEKIKKCEDCPCCNTDYENGMSCNLSVVLDIDQVDVPSNCHLIKVGE